MATVMEPEVLVADYSPPAKRIMNKYNFRVPDIAVFLNQNLHEVERYATRGPDLAIEIVSDDDLASAVFAKARLYFEKGSRVVWVFFPTEKRVTIIYSFRDKITVITRRFLPKQSLGF